MSHQMKNDNKRLLAENATLRAEVAALKADDVTAAPYRHMACKQKWEALESQNEALTKERDAKYAEAELYRERHRAAESESTRLKAELRGCSISCGRCAPVMKQNRTLEDLLGDIIVKSDADSAELTRLREREKAVRGLTRHTFQFGDMKVDGKWFKVEEVLAALSAEPEGQEKKA